MPKKKLTKAQVKKKMKTTLNAVYDLYLDKFAYGSQSIVPVSTKNLEETHNLLLRALTKNLDFRYRTK